ncbi:DUF2505 domain-containing protein [Mycobacterium sp. 1274761.0]|uniref:DUF2505 domain-containing protein n=1 Tax=Mycobacterium sp. 1274761.0 TaxID=1834077 RepID=UPI0007FDD566|nr:DUF2505 domain-containing protein [Mycobacterium sp. 1274761.0]OBK71227.1 hypothetical protein A5651_19595 [Mycobacterium sp. 1274761.0]
MPRSFDFSVGSSVSTAQILSAFSSEKYWLARLAAFGGAGRLDSIDVQSAGSVRVVTVRDLRASLLPGVLAKLYPMELELAQSETWDLCGDVACGEVSIMAHGMPGSGLATVRMAPAHNGPRLDCTATVRVRVPFVGGQIETLMGRKMVDETGAMLRFTDEWLAQHA